MTRVKNLHEGKRVPVGFNSWKDYWEHQTHRRFSLCSCLGCNAMAEHGSHVIKTDSYDKRWYIVPLCPYHNNPYHSESFYVMDNDLVPVNA